MATRHQGRASGKYCPQTAPHGQPFSDIMMPEGMDGVQLAEIMKKEFPTIPILLTSGYSDVATHAVISRFHVIRKPYRLEELEMWLRKLLAIPSV
jgi:DNA-binding LytR/AlgR family response regulator